MRGEAVTLVEPQEVAHRGTFAHRYALERQKGHEPRLMELSLYYVPEGSDNYFDRVDEGEFCVVDVVTRQKGWFEWPDGWEVLDVHRKIEAHFGASAFRVGPRVWFV